jgi:K+/H+ antiporter YhaU regulatory subunit KhtT
MITEQEKEELVLVIEQHRELYARLEKISGEIMTLQEEFQKVATEIAETKEIENDILKSLRKKYSTEITPEFIIREVYETE